MKIPRAGMSKNMALTLSLRMMGMEEPHLNTVTGITGKTKNFTTRERSGDESDQSVSFLHIHHAGHHQTTSEMIPGGKRETDRSYMRTRIGFEKNEKDLVMLLDLCIETEIWNLPSILVLIGKDLHRPRCQIEYTQIPLKNLDLFMKGTLSAPWCHRAVFQKLSLIRYHQEKPKLFLHFLKGSMRSSSKLLRSSR